MTSVSLNTTSATLNVGDTKQLYASVSPSSATDKSVSWSSSNSSIASVTSNGLVTANSSGSATITCKANTTQLTATITPYDATDKSVSWSSGNLENLYTKGVTGIKKLRFQPQVVRGYQKAVKCKT
ncbi:MAG: Ig-like domain-containing protein [Prevotella sp.]|nr:Ig-like domain-containing protein [Prevotella sp.]